MVSEYHPTSSSFKFCSYNATKGKCKSEDEAHAHCSPACVDKSASCKSKHCSSTKKAKKCQQTCSLCGPVSPPPPQPACEDKKGTKWCAKKTKGAKKSKKFCKKMANKCALTCEAC